MPAASQVRGVFPLDILACGSRTDSEGDISGGGEVNDMPITGFESIDELMSQRCVFSYTIPPSPDPQLTKAQISGRLREKGRDERPMVIPALQNRDWREQAHKRRNLYVPNIAPATGADRSVGGLGTRDSMDSGPQLVGLQVQQRVMVEDDSESMEVVEETEIVEATAAAVPKEEDTENQRALRALLA